MTPDLIGPAALLLEGLALGAFILCVGFLLGHWFGPKRNAAPGKQLDDERVAKLLSDLYQFTGSFSHEIAEYRSTLGNLKEKCDATGDSANGAAGNAPEIVSNMLEANERLQRRLNTAEATLRQQAEEISGYLTEARSDALTNLPNRRAFDEECSRRLAQWRRHGSPFSVVLIDVDHFKAFNDRYGHLVGDKVLCDVASVLKETLRETDFVARFGGEEFALVLPAYNVGDAGGAGERMRSAIARAQFAHGACRLQVTVSCGVAQALQNEELPALLQRADQALYAAKRSGRNNAHWHDGLRCVPVKHGGEGVAEGAVSPNLQEACLDLRKRLLEVAAEEKQVAAV